MNPDQNVQKMDYLILMKIHRNYYSGSLNLIQSKKSQIWKNYPTVQLAKYKV